MEKIDYSYKNGINVDRTTFQAGKAINRDSLSVSLNALNEPLNPEDLHNRLENRITHVGKAAVELFIVKSSQPSDGSLNLILTGWQGHWGNFLANNEMRHIVANQNPHSDVIFINHGGQGKSDLLPSPLSKELSRTGKFEPLGQFYADSLKDILPDYDKVSLAGHSYGGRIAIALAGLVPNKASNLVISDSPGSRELTSHMPVLGKLFGTGAIGTIETFASGGKDKNSYDKNNSGYAHDLQFKFDHQPMTNISQYIRHNKSGLVQLFHDQPASLAWPTLEHDLLRAAPNITEKIRLISPEFSEYSPSSVVSDILRRVSEVNKNIKIDFDILERHSHAYTSGHPDVFGYAMRPADKW